MKRFQNILFFVAPGEGYSDALGHAFDLARRNQCSIKLLSVIEPVSRLMARVMPGQLNLEGMIMDNQRSVLDGLASSSRADGLQVTTRIRRGRPFLEIIKEVLEHDHDLVVKSAQGDANDGGALGTTALHLMRKCPCPVWVIKPDSGEFRRVVAAVDPGQDDADQERLQRRIVELGKSLAATYEADLSVVHAWELPGESLLRMRVSSAELEAAGELARDTALKNLHALARDTGLGADHLTLLKGFHGQVVARHIQEVRADLVVMGTLSRSGVQGLLIGNTAERILKGLDCSVMAVKPEGFVSPVALPSGVLPAEAKAR